MENITEINTFDVKEIISKELIKFFERGSKYSIRYLESRSTVNRNYITRLRDKDIQTNDMDISKVYLVLKEILGNEEAKSIIFKNEDLKTKFLKLTSVSENVAKKINLISELEEHISDQDSAIVFTLGINHCGTTISQIKEILGIKGIYALEHLIKHNLLEQNGEKVQLSSRIKGQQRETVISYTRKMYKRMIPAWIQFYQPHRAGQERAHISGVTQSVNREFMREMIHKVDSLRAWVSEETKKPQNMGRIPMFFAMAMDSFIENIDEKEVLQ